jgi:hypothetical protein
MKCTVEANKFSQPPVVLTVPGGSSEGFRRTAQGYRLNHSVLDRFLSVHLGRKGLFNKIRPRRICLVSFGDGWPWVAEILRSKKDVPRIDTVLMINGITTRSLKAWTDFAAKAESRANAPRLWLVHNRLNGVTPAHKRIIKAASSGVQVVVPNYISNSGDDFFPIKVYSKNERPKTKLFHHDPLVEVDRAGNVARFEYAGNTEHDELYLVHHVQPRFWRWLRDLWKDPYSGVFYT